MVSFALASIVCILLLYIPGAAGLLLTKKSTSFSICFSPLVSIAVFEIVAITFSLLDIKTTGIAIAIPAVLISVAIGFLLGRFNKSQDHFEFPLSAFAAGTFLSFVFSWLVFFRPLGYETIISGFDTVFHINLIQAFIDSGAYSPFGADMYNGSAFAPVHHSGGFYPAAWHLICATVREITFIDPAIVVNAANCTFCSVCFANGQAVLFSRIIKTGKAELTVLTVIALLSTAYPWTQLVQGEQFAQISSFAMLPLACALFDVLLECKAKDATVVLCGFCSLLTLATLQTNTVFSLFIFAAFAALRYVRLRSKPEKMKRNYALIVIVYIALWTAAYLCPALKVVVNYEWESTNTVSQAIIKLCNLSLATSGSQPVLALLALIGLIWIIKNRQHIWEIGPIALCSVIYVVATSLSGLPKHYLGGFWYTDPIRLSAQVSIFAFPLIACGVLWLLRLVERNTLLSKNHHSSALAAALSLAIVLITVLSFRMPYVNGGNTAFSILWDSISDYRAEKYEPILSSTELEFANEAKKIAGSDTLILNVPDDGSSILYGQNHTNICYKRNFDLDDERIESKIIREGLNNIATDESVHRAVESIGAKYLMLLDTDDTTGLFHTYSTDSRWKAFYAIDENTPGFKLVLSKDDCRLYEIIG